ncbi:MAG: hypothetical protein JWP63_4492, partial [Candidatus Solibacter sp.]|nr:hypothetical protein [Candidatus Solibacter sp.]
ALNQLNLLNDAGTTWTPATPGTGATLQNSQCSVAMSAVTVTPAVNNLTVTAPLVFKAGYTGAKEVWMYAAGASSNSGWRQLGSLQIDVPILPVAGPITPNSGTNAVQLFTVSYGDAAGASDFRNVWLWFTPTFGSSANTCFVYYDTVANKLNLLNDAGTVWTPVTPGVDFFLQNSQCLISMSSFTPVLGPNTLTLTFTVTFKAAYGGTKQIWGYAAGASANSGWQQLGSWTIAVPQLLSISPLSAGVNSPQFPLTATGSNFQPGAAIQFAPPGGPVVSLQTTFISATQLQATVPASLLTTAGSAQVSVYSASLLTPSQLFVIAGYPTLTSLAPVSAFVNSGPTTLTANGSGFAPGTAIEWVPPGGGAAISLPTNFISAAQVQGTIPASYLTTTGTAAVFILNPGNLSGGLQSFSILPNPQNAVLSAVSLVPNVGSGTASTFVATYSDSDGPSDLASALLWFTPSFGTNAAGTCMVRFDRASGQIGLLNDAGTAFSGQLPGSITTLQNSQCSIDMTGASAAPNNNNLFLTLPITFKIFPGVKQAWMYAGGSAANSGWQQLGAWTVPQPVSVLSVLPASGTGGSQAFQFAYSATPGTSDLRTTWVWFTSSFGTNSSGSCMLYYDVGANLLNLLNDAGTFWTPMKPGVIGTLQNSQCSVPLNLASVTAAGPNLTVAFTVNFTQAYSGAKQTWMYADGSAANSGWQQLGVWTVAYPQIALTAYYVPANGNPAPIAVTGSNFQTGAAVLWSGPNGAPVAPLPTAFQDSAHLQSVIPGSYLTTPGTAQIQVISGNVASASAPVYIYGNPQLTSIAPASAVLNQAAAVTMRATGSGFIPTSLLQWTAPGGGSTSNLPTTFIDSATLQTTIPSSYFTTQGTAQIAAANPGNLLSGSQPFTVATVQTPVVTANSVTPSSTNLPGQTLQLLYSNNQGAADLRTAWMWLTPSFGNNSANSCMIYYDQALNRLNLLNDAGTAFTPVAPGANTVLQNSQCSVNMGGVTVTPNSNNLTVAVPLSVKPAYGGPKQIWMYAAGSTVNSGWQNLGSWTVPSTVVAISVSPNAGAGSQQTFQLLYGDGAGATDLKTVWAWFTPAFGTVGGNTCMVYYDFTTAQLNLLNDAGTAFTPATPGSATTLQNSQCSINMASVTPPAPGTGTANLSLPVTFKPAFAGARQVWMYTAGSASVSGWQQLGSWTAQ